MTNKVNDKYHKSFAKRVAKLAILGATDKVLAAEFNVTPRTILHWKEIYPDFLHEYQKAKNVLNLKVAEALYDQATGYHYTIEEIRTVKDKDGNESLSKIQVEKYSPPKTAAAIHWLKTREPELWRETVNVEHNGLDELLSDIMNQSRGLPSAHPTAEKYNHLNGTVKH